MVETLFLRILLNSDSVAGITDIESSPLCERDRPLWFAVVSCSLHAKVKFDLSGFPVTQNGSVAQI